MTPMPSRHRIAVVHAVHAAVPPVDAAFRRAWPEAERMNVLDDALARDREQAGTLTPAFFPRLRALADYGLAQGATGILFTCSAFGAAIEAIARDFRVPVLKPNEAMFAAALAHGPRVGMLTSFAPGVASLVSELHAMAAASARPLDLRTHDVPAAREALNRGDVDRHDALFAEAATALGDCDCVVLAHFSSASALERTRQAVPCPVLTAPDSAVALLRRRLGA